MWGLIGGLGLAGAAVAVAVADCRNCDNSAAWVAFPVYGALGVGVGVGVDALITRQQVIFERPGPQARFNVAPMPGRGRRGVRLSVAF
jgi:hypothetical protein